MTTDINTAYMIPRAYHVDEKLLYITYFTLM